MDLKVEAVHAEDFALGVIEGTAQAAAGLEDRERVPHRRDEAELDQQTRIHERNRPLNRQPVVLGSRGCAVQPNFQGEKTGIADRREDARSRGSGDDKVALERSDGSCAAQLTVARDLAVRLETQNRETRPDDQRVRNGRGAPE